MTEEKLERLKKTLAKIESYSRDERYFSELETLRKEEYHLEGGKTAEYVMGNYRHNLEQTGWKQAESYRVARRRRPVKGAPSEYSDYIRNFKQDVQDELFRVEMFLNNQK
ncbi:hypothetical protein [Sphingobacterium psychroaquaticum]|uniref:Uncharacterized protein n=1 Tax=Sphingobacterium psychroaquaticum TaxID=561061 RepID=A0A1X7IYI1_9SPHI|nr:hypothetical protein [Sphingobacterium psychroaquaticum]SMG19910.1 hypothetical protein SAMN05660862_1181 [Sphingobacterium psychroaquaticum]